MTSEIPIKEVCPTTTQELIKRGYLLLDVRESSEVQKLAFDVPRIIYIPLSQLEERCYEIPKDETIVVVCHSGERSYRTVAYLKQYGFTNLLNMKKGLEKWVQKGFPTKGDSSTILEHSCCGSSKC